MDLKPVSSYQTSFDIEENALYTRLFLIKDNLNLLLQSVKGYWESYDEKNKTFVVFIEKATVELDSLIEEAEYIKKQFVDIDNEEGWKNTDINFPVGFFNTEEKNTFFQKHILSRYKVFYQNSIKRLYQICVNIVNNAIKDYIYNLDEIDVQNIYYKYNLYKKNLDETHDEKNIYLTESLGYNWFAAEIIQDFIINENTKDNLINIFKVDNKKGLTNPVAKGNSILDILVYHPIYGGIFLTTVNGKNISHDKYSFEPKFEWIEKGNFNFRGQLSFVKSIFDSDKSDKVKKLESKSYSLLSNNLSNVNLFAKMIDGQILLNSNNSKDFYYFNPDNGVFSKDELDLDLNLENSEIYTQSDDKEILWITKTV
jgi:hypothetical protein